jgi:hypothetical protein
MGIGASGRLLEPLCIKSPQRAAPQSASSPNPCSGLDRSPSKWSSLRLAAFPFLLQNRAIVSTGGPCGRVACRKRFDRRLDNGIKFWRAVRPRLSHFWFASGWHAYSSLKVSEFCPCNRHGCNGSRCQAYPSRLRIACCNSRCPRLPGTNRSDACICWLFVEPYRPPPRISLAIRCGSTSTRAG